MKKLTLKFDGMKDMLTKEQMKNVIGASGSSTQSFSSGSSCCCIHTAGDNDYDCGLSKKDAKAQAKASGKAWCCASCSAPDPCEP